MSSAAPVPESPVGYDEPYQFEYPFLVLLLGSISLGLLAAGALGWVIWSLHGSEGFGVSIGDAGSWSVDIPVLPILVAIIVTVVVHELLHGVVFRYFGHDIEYGFLPAKGAFYTAAVKQFQSREELLLVALTPLVVITVLTLPLLLIPHPMVVLTAYLILILNTAGAVGDLYMTLHLLRMPPRTLLYDPTLDCTLVYEPT